MMAKAFTGRFLLALVAVFTITSPYFFDWNVTHIYNPHWPPHAKFHNGQTMAMGALLGLSALFFLFRQSGDRRSNLLAATFLDALYWVSQGFAFWFPGVAWTDPFLLKPGETLDQFPIQKMLDIGILSIVTFAFVLVWTSLPGDAPQSGTMHSPAE